MEYNISKELFEAVMNVECDNVKVDGVFITGLWSSGIVKISTFEFFFNCKEWALGQGSDIWSGYHEEEYFCIATKKGVFTSDSEQQAVFDACQWILDNKE